MKEPKRRQSLSGAVLVMILTVMFVLIILLTATLTTVTTANQRIYTKFEENQAYYTARSALDVFTQNMLADKSYYAYADSSTTTIKYKYGNGQEADMKQGLGLQLDLYSITSQGGMNITQSALYSYANSISVAADKKDEYKNYFGIKPTAGAPATVGSDINEIWYEVTLPQTGNGSNTYGKLSDYKSGTTTSVAKIKVEVLDRRYDMGAFNFTSGAHSGTDVKTYLDTLSDDDLKDFFDTMNTSDAKDVATAIIMGSRKKDKMRVKITATSTFDGVEGTAVLIYDTHESKQVPTSQAITSLSDLAQGSGLFPIGGASALFDGEVKFNQSSITTGSIYLQGSLNSQDLSSYLSGNDILFVKKDCYWQNQAAPIVKEKGATVFIGGTLTIDTGASGTFGSTGNEANLIVGTLKNQNNFSGFYGNVYCDTLDLSSGNDVKVTNGSVYANKLILNGSSSLNGTDLNITVNGPTGTSINLGTNSIIAEIKEWDPTAPNAWGGFGDNVIKYTVDCATTPPTVYDASGNVYTAGAVNVSLPTLPTVDSSKKVNIDLNDYTTTPLEADGTRIFEMPANIITSGAATTKNVVIPTVSKLYKDYFDASAFKASTGEFDFTPSSPTLSDDDRRAEFSSFLASHVITSEEKYGGVTPVTTFDKYSNNVTVETRDSAAEAARPAAEQIPVAFTNVITGSGKLELSDRNGNGHNYGLIAIDARDNPIEIQLNDDLTSGETYYAGQFVVFGDKEVTFLLAGSQKTNLGGPTGSCVFEIYSSEIYNIANSGSPTLKLGNTTNATSAPKVNFYVASSIPEVILGHETFVTGYLYMPNTLMNLGGGLNGKKFSTTYDGYSIDPADGNLIAYGAVGSVFCQGYKSAQKAGVAYIEQSGDNGTPGDPIHDWQSYQYVRN